MTTIEIFDRLRDLQEILVKKIGLESEIRTIPKTLASQEELVERLKSNFIERDHEYVDAKKIENELRNSHFEAVSEREKSEKKMDAIETQREFEILTKEIENAAKSEKEYSERLREAEEKANSLNVEMQQNKDLIDQQEKELEERKRSIELELASRKKQLDDISIEEKKLTDGMDPELIFKFERIIRKKGGHGIVAVKGGVCNSCHMILPVQFANSVRTGKEVISCPYCSSILYYEEISEDEEDFFYEASHGSLSGEDAEEDEEYDDDSDNDEEYDEKINSYYED